ncbi:MAG: hypothetical protein CME66_11665 [Halobacteriovoraceae bacterium]|nr:hypothetical protein [Halobacteriovoraceae bacterium]
MKLKTKLIALNTVILFVVGTMMFLQFRAAQNKQKYEIRKGFAQTSEKLQRAISNVFYLYYHNAQNIALNNSLKTKDFEQANFYFNELVSLYPLYNMIVFVDKEGRYIASNSLDGTGKKLVTENIKSYNFAQAPWFKALKEGKLVEDYNKNIFGSYFGDTQKSEVVSKLFGTDKFGNYFATNVTDEFGEVLGYVATFVDKKWITNELVSTKDSLAKEGMEGASIWVANKEGLVISEVLDGKLELKNFLKLNLLNQFGSEIEKSKALEEPTFVEAMFKFDESPLYAFSDFDNQKFVNEIGWDAFIEMESDTAFSAISVASNIFSISFFVILLAGSFVAFLASTKLSNSLLKMAQDIAKGSINISDASGSLSEHSGNLSSATSEQASSLQETVASLNEISAMVNKNTDASQGSKSLSEKSRSAAEVGKGTINKMLGSIDEISEANAEIIDQMNQNANEIQEIISVIKEIEDKTKVINDIVFQTKLLSFNASVEAARAGEHGKGFSVVAEEVGNLAQHSGDAAKQIEDMLVQSVSKVESIAKNTELKVKDLIEKGTKKVEQGKDVARQCDGALGEILNYANNLDSMIEEIAIASVEQAQGIQEISKAMSELDQVTKQNSMIAHETSLSTQSLNKQAKSLKDISISLTDLITGQKEVQFDHFEKNDSKGDRQVYSAKEQKDHSHHETKSAKSSQNILELKPKDKESVEKDDKNETHVKSEKKVASSDISVPSSSEGDWEDI